MGLTDDCKTAKKLATRCKNWQILTVIRKKRLLVKKKLSVEKTKKETKTTRFPAPGFEPWPRTATWCSQMLYPLSCGELVNNADGILKSCFRRLTHCKDQAWKHTCYSIGRREFSLPWFAIDPNNEKKLFPLRFAIFMKVYLSSLIRESQWGYPIVVKQQNAMR